MGEQTTSFVYGCSYMSVACGQNLNGSISEILIVLDVIPGARLYVICLVVLFECPMFGSVQESLSIWLSASL